jgi:hypothetical protein
MKEKINLVQLTTNHQKEVKAGATGPLLCNNPDYQPYCKCAHSNNICARVSQHQLPCKY